MIWELIKLHFFLSINQQIFGYDGQTETVRKLGNTKKSIKGCKCEKLKVNFKK